MKNKTLKIIGVMVITTFILSYLSTTALVSAANGEPNFILETSEAKNYGMGVIQTERSVAATLQMNGEVSGGFTYTDFLGNPQVAEDSVFETENSHLYYPVNLRYENYWNTELLREFSTHYARARNVSDLPDQHGNYTASFVTEQYELSVDTSCEISVSDLTSEILFDVSSKGIYQIWMNNINLIGSPVILSPTDKFVIPVENELPPVIDGGDSLGKYFFFAAYETGIYRIYLQTGDPIITLRAEHHKGQSIKLGEAIRGGKDPSDPTFFDTVYSMDVYQLDVKNLETVYKYLLDFEYGSPSLYYFVEDSLTSYSSSLNPGINRVLPSVTDSKVYIVIDNPNYFSWADPGIDEADPLKYTMKFDEVEPIEHIIGGNQTINLAKSIGVTARTFEIVNTSLVSFHFEDLGANSPNVFGNKIIKIDEEQARDASIPSTISSSNGTFMSALLEPGKYKVIFQHSGSMGPEYLHFYTKLVEFQPLNVEGMDLSGTLPYNFTGLNFEDVTLPAWEGYPNTYGATYPLGFNISIDENFWDYGYNVSIHADKNAEIFDDYITPDLAVLWDDDGNDFTDYTEAIQPGNATKVPVKTIPSGDVGDALIIGAYDKFDRIEVTLADPSDRDAFEWQYYREFWGWRDFDAEDPNFDDGTLTATGSLNKSGTLSWDPEELTNWNFFSSGSDDIGSERPNTDDENYYLIRVRCTDDAADIANITSVRLRKFTKINLDLGSKLAFNIGTPEKPVYYRASSGSSSNLKFASSYNQSSYLDVVHTIDKNYYSEEAILYLYASDIQLYDYNGSNNGVYVPLEKPLTYSVCVFQPEANYKQIIPYNISLNVPTTHSNQLNLSALPSDQSNTIIVPDRRTVYLNITPRTMYDWTQINVQFINASVLSTRLIAPAMYDLDTASTYTSTYGNGQFNLGYTGVNMNASIEFGFITETLYLEFVIENTTNNSPIMKTYGGQFNYPMLTILEASVKSNTGLYVGIGAGVVVLIAVSVVLYKKKH
ncbi:hypothetical protein DSAG12_02883 [Promethearchaeum syntrophicum]|uniref:Uncharacterized protein n=1 Tax=Promethearchaeum syntrophicum TaxID=2594042 RepID=A0A5B9DDE0_9ARCH|nr:hypothetical protein [Candidatus Prometheoarchaeum syntrophicum]